MKYISSTRARQMFLSNSIISDPLLVLADNTKAQWSRAEEFG